MKLKCYVVFGEGNPCRYIEFKHHNRFVNIRKARWVIKKIKIAKWCSLGYGPHQDKDLFPSFSNLFGGINV